MKLYSGITELGRVINGVLVSDAPGDNATGEKMKIASDMAADSLRVTVTHPGTLSDGTTGSP